MREFLSADFLTILAGAVLASVGVVVGLWAVWYRRRRWPWWAAIGAGLIVLGLAISLPPYFEDKSGRDFVASMVASAAPVIGWALIAWGTAVMGWGFFADRARGRLRCPRCWYPMEGAAGLVCPECGRDARRPERLLKTRRQWKLIAAGPALALVGYAGTLWPRARDRGIASVLPTPVLMLVLEAEGWPRPSAFPTRDIGFELMQRISQGRWACLRGLAYRRMARYWTLDYRARWPAGVPMAVKPSRMAWFAEPSRLAHLEARLVSESGPSEWTDIDEYGYVHPGFTERWTDGYITWGSLPDGARKMDVEFRLMAGVSGDAKAALLWADTISYPIDVGGSVDEVISPVRSTSIDDEITDGVQPFGGRSGISSRATAKAPLCDGIGLRLAGIARAAGVATALRFELVQNGRTVDSARVWDAEGTPGDLGLGMFARLVLRLRNGGLRFSDSSWSVRISADPELALRDFKKSKYWSGQLTITPAQIEPSMSGSR